jgi:hypothetical protein
MQVQVRVNEDGALRNQRFAFTDRYTLVTELLQNARRAGASGVEIRHNAQAKTLEVSDDGRGIADFQKLFSFHESGWSPALQRNEHPFGVGFSKCLYAATRCRVESGHQCVDFETEPALNREPIDVIETEHAVHGTRVVLWGVDLPNLAGCIESICEGFPIPVRYNDNALTRRHAEQYLVMQSSPIGAVHLTGTRDGRFGHSMILYLQGFRVYRTLSIDSATDNVVHLDPTQFMARTPDRDKLIDEDIQVKRVDEALTECWRRTLDIALTQMDAQHFVDTYHKLMRYRSLLHVMNPLPVLPRRICRVIAGYPTQYNALMERFDEPVESPITREDVEQRKVMLVGLDPVSAENSAHWMFARLKGWVLLRETHVDAEHWVVPWIRSLDGESISVEPVGETARAMFSGRWVSPTVVICDTVRLAIGDDAVESKNEAVVHDDVIYVPRGEDSGIAVRQLSDYTDSDDRLLDGELADDQEDLAVLIRRLRNTDPAATLTALLRDIQPGLYPQLHGQSFRVSIASSPAADPVVDVLPAAGAEVAHG